MIKWLDWAVMSIPQGITNMEYFPFSMIHQSTLHQHCIPYPTFAQLLARLDDLQPNFGWREKFSQPLAWLFGNRSLDTVGIDRLDYAMPDALCVIFDIPPAWVLVLCEAMLVALEDARAQALQLHRDSHQDCHECGGYFRVCG